MENSFVSSLISIISSMLDKNVINITPSDSGIFLNEISKKIIITISPVYVAHA